MPKTDPKLLGTTQAFWNAFSYLAVSFCNGIRVRVGPFRGNLNGKVIRDKLELLS